MTPPGFAQAIEDGNEPSAGDTQAMNDLITDTRIRALLYNAQATSPVTQHVQDLARRQRDPRGARSPRRCRRTSRATRRGNSINSRRCSTALGRLTMAVVVLRDASMRFGARTLFEHLDLELAPGEFLAVLGPNGAGKTTLLRVLLGLTPLSSGAVEIDGRPPRRGSHDVGYVPQQRAFDRDLPIRGRDLVRFGLDGHRRGLPFGTRVRAARRVDAAIRSVGAERYADAPIGLLSGGEQQRLRIAQALIGDPKVLLCDEPLLSLDLSHQQEVSELIDARRREAGCGVVFVTHEINPILPYVDRVLYLAGGQCAVGTPDEVLTSAGLSELYGTEIDVLNVRGRIIVVGSDDARADRARRPSPPPPRRSRSARGGFTLTATVLYLNQPFAQHALIAGALVAISCGLIGPFVVTRGMAFAVHGTSELAFTGAAARVC